MAKNDIKANPSYTSEVYDKNVKEANISDVCTEYMKIYGGNVNILRHTPFLIDGLKPCARRLLYTMWEIYKAHHDSKFRKVATIVAQVMTIHPHGDSSIYEVLVKLAQPWNNLVCLIEGSGNIGGIDGSPAAASRYLEARLSFFAYKCFFEDFDKSVCHMQTSYNGETQEPEFLPSRYPYVIINNSFGIGYGVSNSIPPFNFKEVCDLTINLMKNPNLKDVYLVPDIATGCLVIDEGNFKDICATGRGKFKMRGKVVIKDNVLKILSIPPKTNSIDIKTDILKLRDQKKLMGLENIVDDSAGDRVYMELKFSKDTDLKSVEYQLYKATNLQRSDSINFSVVNDYLFETFSLKEILLHWIDFRRNLKRKIYNKKYVKGSERLHLLDVLIFVLNGENLEKTSYIVKKSKDKKQIVERLMLEYDISSLQAKYISDMKFSGFTLEAREKYQKERDELVKNLDEWEDIMTSDERIDKIIIDELKEGIKLFGEPRRSEVISIEGENAIPDTQHTIVITMNGKIKKLSEDVTEVGHIDQGDYPIDILHINNQKDLFIFDDSGVCYRLPVSKIDSTNLEESGDMISKYVKNIGRVLTMITKPTCEDINKLKEEFNKEIYFVIVTRKGMIKKTSADRFTGNTSQLTSIVLKDDDEPVSVLITIGDKDLVVYTNNGLGIRINTDTFKETARASMGVKAITLEDDEYVSGATIVNDTDTGLFILSEKGYGKKCSLSSFSRMDRGVKPLKLMTLLEKDSLRFVRSIKGNEVFNIFLKTQVLQVDVEELTDMTRISKGHKLIPVPLGNRIIGIKQSK